MATTAAHTEVSSLARDSGLLSKLRSKFQSRYLRFGLLVFSLLAIRQISLHTSGLINGPVLCPIRLATGFPCPACGTTRAIGALSEGRFRDSLAFNPLGFIVIGSLFVWSLNLKPVRSLNRSLNEKFSELNLLSRVSFLLITYAIAWILNIFRVNSATF